MSKERGKRYTKEQKQELLELFGESGLSVARFCREMKLSYGTLKRWLDPEPSQSVRFVEIDEADSSAGRLSLALPNGLWVEFPVSAPKPAVASWIRELKAC